MHKLPANYSVCTIVHITQNTVKNTVKEKCIQSLLTTTLLISDRCTSLKMILFWKKRKKMIPLYFVAARPFFTESLCCNQNCDAIMTESDKTYFFWLDDHHVLFYLGNERLFRSALLTTPDTLGRYSSLVFSHFLDFLAVFLPNNSSTKTNEEFTQWKDVYLSTMC